MSYCRGNYYIWPDVGGVTFCCADELKTIPHDYIDVFLYSLSKRRSELKARLKNGKKLYNKNQE